MLQLSSWAPGVHAAAVVLLFCSHSYGTGTGLAVVYHLKCSELFVVVSFRAPWVVL